MWIPLYFLLSFTAISILPNNVRAAPAHRQGLFSTLNLGVKYSSLLQKRGALLDPASQLSPVVTAFFFDDRLEFLGDSLSYRDFLWTDGLRWRTRAARIGDLPRREDSYEWSNSLEWFLPGYNDDYRAEINFTHAKDLVRHHGNYFELMSKIKLGEFRAFRTKVEPNLVAALGWGDRSHNDHFYGGSEGRAGINNSILGLSLLLPEKADRHYNALQLIHFSTTHPRHQGWLFSFIAALNVLK